MRLVRVGLIWIVVGAVLGTGLYWSLRTESPPTTAKPLTAPDNSAATAANASSTEKGTSAPAKTKTNFGGGVAVHLDDLPESTLRKQIAALPPATRETALARLSAMQFHVNDVASLRADTTGMILFVCEGIAVSATDENAKAVLSSGDEPVTAATPENAPVPVSNPPAHSSRPGATNVVYLDFNGHVVAGTQWNAGAASSWTFPAYDLDGDATTFSDAEQTAIFQIWQRVAEDFAPFNINVTTVEPATFTPRTGRVLITRSYDVNGVAAPWSTAGGVAYVGVFNFSNYVSSYHPAFVYYNNLAGGRPDIVAEAVSHEFGHNLGLSHDGTRSGATYYSGHGSGATSWGPIMGTGYYDAVSQWSKGEYYDANNTEDDLATMAGHLSYRPDDNGNAPATASTLTPTGNAISASGVIEQNTDVDYFRLTLGGGSVNITAAPFRSTQYTNGGNLDIQLRLLDANSTVVATTNPADETRATLTATVAGGTYYLEVAPVGTGAPLSNPPSGYTVYGSLGQYTLTGTVPTVPVITSALNAYGYVGTPFSYSITAPGATTFNATGLPPGVTVNMNTGQISGTPTSAGVFGITIAAANNYGTDTRALTLNVAPAAPPVITSALAATASANVAFTYTITSTNNPTTFNAVGLPAGLTVNLDTGVISGTPYNVGTFNVTIAAANPFGRDSRTLVLSVAPHPQQPAITSSLTVSAVAGASFSYTITATNTPTAFNATGLPPGLNVNLTNGAVSGIPTATGTFHVTLAAANNYGRDTRTLALTVSAPSAPVISSPLTASGQTGSFFSYAITASNQPTAFNATGLPLGLSINQSTGMISGTPTEPGTYGVTLAAANYGGRDTKTLTLTIASQPAPSIYSATTASTQTGANFSYTIAATNNPTSFNALGLPPGLVVNTSTGNISGVPTTAGTYAVSIAAANYGGRDAKTLSITVAAAPPPVITSTLTAAAETGKAFSYTITATNSPASFNALGLPAGLTVNTTTGVISGTPSVIGTFNVELAAANYSATDRKILVLTVVEGPPINDSFSNAVSLGSARSGNMLGTNVNATSESGEILQPNSAGRTVWYKWLAPTDGVTPITPLTLSVESGDPILAVYVGGSVGSLAPVAANDDDPSGGTLHSVLSFNAVGGNTYYVAVDSAPNRTAPFVLSWSTALRAPLITNQGAIYVTAGRFVSCPIVSLYGAVTFTATGLPPGLSMAAESIVGTPTTPGTYSATVTAGNPTGRDTRTISIVVIAATAVPPNDNFANELPITGGFGTVMSSNVNATAETGEPPHWNGTYRSIWYRWTAPSSGTAAINTSGSSFDTTLAVYTGSSIAALTNVARNDDAADVTSAVTFSATAGTTYHIAVDAYSGGYGAVRLNWSGLVALPPVITSPLTATATVNTNFSYSIAAKNSPHSFNALGLPLGLSVNLNTGTISGTPTSTGVFDVDIAAANNFGRDSRTLRLTVVPQAPVITSALNASGRVAVPFDYSITASNSPTAFNATGLPPGLSINTTTGAISGTPTVSGTFGITIAAANTGGRDSRTLTLTVAPPLPPVITSAASANAHLRFPFSYTITATNGPTSYNAIGLPSGLTIDTTTGVISGAPTAVGTFSIQLRAANTVGTAVVDATLVIRRAPQDSFLSGNQTDLLLENTITGDRVIWRMAGTSIVSSANLPTFTSGWHFAGSGDFDGDGRADIVLQNTMSGERVIWLMDGATILSSVALPTLPLSWQIACVADADADDNPDVFLQNTTTGERVIWKMAGTTIQTSLALPTLPTSWLICGATDFSGDGRADIVLQNTESGERVIWIMNASMGIAQSANLPGSSYDGLRIAGVGRLTVDSRPNIILQNTITGERLLWSIAANYTVAQTYPLPLLPVDWSFGGPATNAAKSPAGRDFDRDGTPDILFSTERSHWGAMLLRDGRVRAEFPLSEITADWRVAPGADFNGDGFNDLLLQNTTTGTRAIWLMRGHSLGYPTNLPTLPLAWQFECVTDLNRDGRGDIVLRNMDNGQQVVWIMDGRRIHSSVALPTLPVAWRIVASGTFAADGRVHLVLENSATGEHVIWIVESDGAVIRSIGLPTLAFGWRIAAAADYDQDGNTDLLVHHPETGLLIIWIMDGATIKHSIQLPSVYAPTRVDG
jgi:PKD repeat protein